MVKSLVAESALHRKYMDSFERSSRAQNIKDLVFSFLLGLSQFGQYFMFAAVFYAAGHWIVDYDLDMQRLFMALFALFFGVMGASMANQFLSDLGKANQSSQM